MTNRHNPRNEVSLISYIKQTTYSIFGEQQEKHCKLLLGLHSQAVLVLGNGIASRLTSIARARSSSFRFSCIGAMFWASAMLMVARWYLIGVYHLIPIETSTILARSWLLLVCGSCALLSLVVETTSLGKIFRFFLGSYWLVMAYAGFSFAVGIIQYRALSIKLNLIVPAMIGIIAFSGLAFELSKLQRETAREAVPQAIEAAR